MATTICVNHKPKLILHFLQSPRTRGPVYLLDQRRKPSGRTVGIEVWIWTLVSGCDKRHILIYAKGYCYRLA